MILSERTLTDRTPADRALGGAARQQQVASAEMAGFVVWLAGQRVPLPQRTRVYREVEAFLAWQHTEFPDGVPAQRPAVWCYLLHRQQEGDSEAEVLKVWGALELLLTFVERRSPLR